MALNAGNAECTTGLSKRVYDYWVADARSGFVSPLNAAAIDCIRAQSYAIARAVVDEIAANAAVTVTISTGTGALQQAGGVDTTAPTAPRTLPGTVA